MPTTMLKVHAYRHTAAMMLSEDRFDGGWRFPAKTSAAAAGHDDVYDTTWHDPPMLDQSVVNRD